MSKSYKEIARSLIKAYFHGIGEAINPIGLDELLKISNDDYALYEHINAWINILNKAKQELEEEWYGKTEINNTTK